VHRHLVYSDSFHPSRMSSSQVRNLYKQIVSTASSFRDTNFREYFVRVAQDDFKAFESAKGKVNEADFVAKQLENLEVLKRQSVIQNMYYSDSFAVRR
jgi:hypothetical protein